MGVGLALLLANLAPDAFAQGQAQKASLKVDLETTGEAQGATGKFSMKLNKGKSSMDVQVAGLLPDTEYEVRIDGVTEARFTTSRAGKAKVSFRTRPNRKQAALDFDPRGRQLIIARENGDDDDEPLFVEIQTAAPFAGGVSDERALIPTTTSGARVMAHVRAKKDGRRDFGVDAQGLAAGSYDLWVGGIERGQLETSGKKGKGKLAFLNPDFNPGGEELTLTQGDVVIATGPFLAAIPGVNVCSPESTEVDLAPQGGAPGSARAELKIAADCQRTLEIEVDDVPAGSYNLLADGVQRGTISVAGGHGEIELESQGSGDDELEGQPLDFDPTATLEIAQGDTVLFSGSLANGSPGEPTGCSEPESEVEVALFNTGASSEAKGKARYRVRDDCESDFRVEVENIEAANYELRVGGVVRGTIVVVPVGGELEFDTDPDEPGELQLDFDPRGETIEVRRNGTTYLSREFPAAP
jgi:hypothetical protein